MKDMKLLLLLLLSSKPRSIDNRVLEFLALSSRNQPFENTVVDKGYLVINTCDVCVHEGSTLGEAAE